MRSVWIGAAGKVSPPRVESLTRANPEAGRDAGDQEHEVFHDENVQRGPTPHRVVMLAGTGEFVHPDLLVVPLVEETTDHNRRR